MEVIHKSIATNHFVHLQAATANLRQQGYTKEQIDDPDKCPDFTIGPPVKLPGRKIYFGESGQYYYKKLIAVV